MPNIKTGEELREVAPGKKQYVRVVQRDKAVELLALGESVKDVASAISCSINSIYKWLKEPEFAAKLDQARELICIDAINSGASLISLATQSLQKGLENDKTGRLGLDLLDKMGVMRTTGAKLGMEQKDSAASGISVTINMQGNGNCQSDTIIDVKADTDCADNDHSIANITTDYE